MYFCCLHLSIDIRDIFPVNKYFTHNILKDIERIIYNPREAK